MNTCVVLGLQEGRVQRGGGKHEQWRGYMNVPVVNNGIIKSIRTLTMVIRLRIKFDIDQMRDYICQEVKWTLGIC